MSDTLTMDEQGTELWPGGFAAMLDAAPANLMATNLDLELVYGHCWGAGPKNDPAAWRIDASQIPLRR